MAARAQPGRLAGLTYDSSSWLVEYRWPGVFLATMSAVMAQ